MSLNPEYFEGRVEDVTDKSEPSPLYNLAVEFMDEAGDYRPGVVIHVTTTPEGALDLELAGLGGVKSNDDAFGLISVAQALLAERGASLPWEKPQAEW